MSEPKRYTAAGEGIVRSDANGELVLFSDYARLKAEVERLEKDVWRMKVVQGIDEDSIQTLRAALKTVPEWAKALEAIENNARLEAENNTLKAEVERLKAVSTIEQRTIQGLQQTPEWSEIARLTAECRRLEAENNRLRASSFVTAVPVEQYERLREAGDALAAWTLTLEHTYDHKPMDGLPFSSFLCVWHEAAKEGKHP